MDGKLDCGRSETEGKPGVFSDRERLVEPRGEGFKVGSEGSGRDRGVRHNQGDRSFIVDKGFEGAGEGAACGAENRGSYVRPPGADVKGVGVGGGR